MWRHLWKTCLPGLLSSFQKEPWQFEEDFRTWARTRGYPFSRLQHLRGSCSSWQRTSRETSPSTPERVGRVLDSVRLSCWWRPSSQTVSCARGRWPLSRPSRRRRLEDSIRGWKSGSRLAKYLGRRQPLCSALSSVVQGAFLLWFESKII